MSGVTMGGISMEIMRPTEEETIQEGYSVVADGMNKHIAKISVSSLWSPVEIKAEKQRIETHLKRCQTLQDEGVEGFSKLIVDLKDRIQRLDERPDKIKKICQNTRKVLNKEAAEQKTALKRIKALDSKEERVAQAMEQLSILDAFVGQEQKAFAKYNTAGIELKPILEPIAQQFKQFVRENS